ncbi:protein kinase domain-containing protein [Sorangium sp. So ce204]|uniref:protein kinase domain-containing protein n=1 Tax=Sorangium sp. So ce204 TaxID=3133288 RepID=UPI003F5F0AA6
MRGLEEIEGLEAGTLIAGKYRVDRLLDKGAMGAVVAATHVDLDELRAIKVLLPATAADPEMCGRFLQEARIASRLRSEHAVKVHDVGRLESGLPYMVMEFLDGRDLRVIRKQRGPLPVEEATLYVIQACDALAEAHALGLVHRDVKPANLFLTHTREGTPCIKVLDFGVSKVSQAALLGVAEMRTSTGQMLGTPHYMPPEQMRGQRDVDARADIWAVGSLLYVLLTGRYPMHARSVQTVSLVLGGKFVPELPSKVCRGLSPDIDPIIMRCLERDRDKRWPDLAELTMALRPFAPPAAQPLVDRIQRMLRGGLRDSLSGARPGVDGIDAGERGSIPTTMGSGPSTGGMAIEIRPELPPPVFSAAPEEADPVERSEAVTVSDRSRARQETDLVERREAATVSDRQRAPAEADPGERSEAVTVSERPRARAEASPAERSEGATVSGRPRAPAEADPVARSEGVAVPDHAGVRAEASPAERSEAAAGSDGPQPRVEAGRVGLGAAGPAPERARVEEDADETTLADTLRRLRSPVRASFVLAAVAAAIVVALLVSGTRPEERPSGSSASGPLAGATLSEARNAEPAGQVVPAAAASSASLPRSSEPAADIEREALREPSRRTEQEPRRPPAAPRLPASGSLPSPGSPPGGKGVPVSAPPR